MILATERLDTVVSQLVQEFPDQVFQESHDEYKVIQQSYWSGTQKDLRPRAYFQPHSAKEVGQAIKLCAAANCAFGVKSGGHGHYAGQSCLEGGIQLDLAKLNNIVINKDKNTATVGPGCRWRAVYDLLQKENLMVLGGRSADVGVGGFLIGGGISFYAAQHGWGIDRVRSFEVVLATGEVVKASRDNHPRLFRALRGGGSNLGIITAFELELLPYYGIWGGRTTVNIKHAEVALKAYADFIPNLDIDPKGHTILIFDYHKGEAVARQYLAYTEPKADVPMFHNLRQVPTIDSNLGLQDYSDIAADIALLQEGGGLRHAVSTMTIRLDYELLKFIYQLYMQESRILDDHGYGCLEFHALPRSPVPTDNMYGLDGNGKPLIAVMLAFSTADKRYDFALLALQQRVLGKIRCEAEARDLYHPFLFANYAGPFQDVAGSYGASSIKILCEAAKEYDPEGVFQRLQPGGYKLGAHSPDS